MRRLMASLFVLLLVAACSDPEVTAPVDTPAEPVPGDSCDDDTDCGGYACLQGVCIEECNIQATLFEQCGEGRNCLPYYLQPCLSSFGERETSCFEAGLCELEGEVEEGRACSQPYDCAPGLACLRGTCRQVCQLSSPDCEICRELQGSTRAEFDLGFCREFGDECTFPDDCGEHVCIRKPEGGGACRQRCDNPDGACEDGSLCGGISGQSYGVCLNFGDKEVNESCSSVNDCASGLRCIVIGGDGYCRPFCVNDADCAESAQCEEISGSSSGACVERFGRNCRLDSQCPGDAVCSTIVDASLLSTFPEGYCTRICSSDGDCGETGRCRVTNQRSICLAGCQSDADCNLHLGYRCLDSATCSLYHDLATCRELIADGSVCLYTN